MCIRDRQNLIRVNDILSELEKQVGPLERQSEKAREYLKKKEELKTYDINMFLLEADRLKEQIRDVEAKDNLTKAQMGEANRLYEDTKQEYESIEAVSYTHLDSKTSYAMYPVWLLNTTWKGQKYTFAMNGQSGKIVGDLPADEGAFWKYVGTRGILISVILYIIMMVVMFL